MTGWPLQFFWYISYSRHILPVWTKRAWRCPGHLANLEDGKSFLSHWFSLLESILKCFFFQSKESIPIMVYLDHPKHVQPCPLDFPSGKTYVPTLCSCHLSPQSLTWLRLFSVWSEPLVLRCSAHLTSTFKTFSPDFLNDNFASSLNTNESILIWSKTFFGVSKLRRVKFLSFFLSSVSSLQRL